MRAGVCECVCVCARVCVCVRACVRACMRAGVLYIFVLKVVGEVGGLALIFRVVPHIPEDHVPIPTHASCCRLWAATGCCTIGCDSDGNSADSCFRCSSYS